MSQNSRLDPDCRPSLHGERGATAVEYALMIALLGLVITVSVSLVGGEIREVLGQVSTTIANSPASSNGGGGGGGGSNGANNNGQGDGWGGGVGGGQGHN